MFFSFYVVWEIFKVERMISWEWKWINVFDLKAFNGHWSIRKKARQVAPTSRGQFTAGKSKEGQHRQQRDTDSTKQNDKNHERSTDKMNKIYKVAIFITKIKTASLYLKALTHPRVLHDEFLCLTVAEEKSLSLFLVAEYKGCGRREKNLRWERWGGVPGGMESTVVICRRDSLAVWSPREAKWRWGLWWLCFTLSLLPSPSLPDVFTSLNSFLSLGFWKSQFC